MMAAATIAREHRKRRTPVQRRSLFPSSGLPTRAARASSPRARPPRRPPGQRPQTGAPRPPVGRDEGNGRPAFCPGQGRRFGGVPRVYEHCAEPVFGFLRRMLATTPPPRMPGRRPSCACYTLWPASNPPGGASDHLGPDHRPPVALNRELAGQGPGAANTRRTRAALHRSGRRWRRAAAGAREAVAGLPVEQRTVFVLREAHAMSYQEIASIEGIDRARSCRDCTAPVSALQRCCRDRLETPNGRDTGETRARA